MVLLQTHMYGVYSDLAGLYYHTDPFPCETNQNIYYSAMKRNQT